MKKTAILLSLIMCLLLTACNEAASIGIIGGADGPTSVIVSEKAKNDISAKDAEKFFSDNYVNERKLPILDVHIENPYIKDDRTLVLDDSIENNLEFMVYEYYKNIMSGDYSNVKAMVEGEALTIATENEEKQFADGMYYEKVILDDIELIEKDDLKKISADNKIGIVKKLLDNGMSEFAIVEVEMNVKLNDKYLALGPQVGNGERTRFYLLGKKGDGYKIAEVYWEGFIID